MFRAWVVSPGGYTALPMRVPTTRMIVVVMGADNKGANGRLSTPPARQKVRRSMPISGPV